MNHYDAIVKRGNENNGCKPNPMSETRVRLPLRIPVSLKVKLAELAEREHRSLNKQIEFLLDRCVREETNYEKGDSGTSTGVRSKRK